MMRLKLIQFLLLLLLGSLIIYTILRSVVILQTKYFARGDELDERIVTMKKACLKYADKWNPEYMFSKVDRFSLGC